MKPILPACCLLTLSLTGLRADPADDAIVAGMKLSTSPSYSWTTTTVRGSQTVLLRGQTGSSGYSLLTFVGYALASAPAGGRSSGSGNEISAVFLGDSKYVVQTGSGWTTPDNLPASSSSSVGNGSGSGRTRNAGGGGGLSGGGTGGTGLGGGRRSSNRSSRNSGNQESGSGGPPGLPNGINLPHEELAIIVANYTDLHTDGAIASGSLTEIGADLLLVPPGSNDTPPENATGTFRLWISGGGVTKYEVKIAAKTGPGGRAVSGGFSETITVELKNVGSTSFEVPDAAKRRLGG